MHLRRAQHDQCARRIGERGRRTKARARANTWSRGCGSSRARNRRPHDRARPADEDERALDGRWRSISAFSWPKLCSWSGFSEAYVSTARRDERREDVHHRFDRIGEQARTEPVRKYAANLSTMTTTDVANRDPCVEGGRNARLTPAPFLVAPDEAARLPCTTKRWKASVTGGNLRVAAMHDVPLSHDGEIP